MVNNAISAVDHLCVNSRRTCDIFRLSSASWKVLYFAAVLPFFFSFFLLHDT